MIVKLYISSSYFFPMIKCSKCGTNLPDGSKFCQKCGTKLAQQSSSPDINHEELKVDSMQTAKDTVNSKLKEPEINTSKRETHDTVKPEKENVGSSKTINTSSAAIVQGKNESEKKDTNQGKSPDPQKQFNEKDSNEPISDEKSKVSSVKESKEPSPAATSKPNLAPNQDSKKEILPENLSPLGKRLYELKMLYEHKIITEEEYNQRKKKALEDYINS